jgi:hypothetical protein
MSPRWAGALLVVWRYCHQAGAGQPFRNPTTSSTSPHRALRYWRFGREAQLKFVLRGQRRQRNWNARIVSVRRGARPCCDVGELKSPPARKESMCAGDTVLRTTDSRGRFL